MKKIDTPSLQQFATFQPMKGWVNKVNLSSFELENFFQICTCLISTRKAKHVDATTMFTYSHANTPLGQSEHVYYLSYFISDNNYKYLLLYCALSLNINSYITQRKSSLQINFINQ